MRVLLSTYRSRGDVEPVVGLAVALRALGAEVRVCAPPDFAERLAGVGVPMVPVGPSASALTAAAPPPSSIPRRAAELIADQFDAVTAAAEGCDAIPQLADQPYWGGRVADLGIGAAHDGPIPTIESLSAALKAALTPETRVRATAVAATIRTDGATVAANLLLDAISRDRPPVSA